MRHAVLILGLAGAFIVLSAASPASAQVAAADVARLAVSTAAADHRSLADHYRSHAAEHEADAARHETIAAEAKGRTGDDESWDLARDAAHYAQHSREAAEALRDLAQLHDAIADRLSAAKGSESTPAAKSCCKGMMDDKSKAKPTAPAPTHDHGER